MKGERYLDASDLMEEAVYLLRNAQIKAWFYYLVGGIPFLVMLLVFWTTMSQSPYAHQQLAAYSLLLTISYFWMKFWQTRFLVALRRQYSSCFDSKQLDSWWVCLRRQMIFQPAGFFVLPVAFVSTVLFPSALAFFQNLSGCESIGKSEQESVLQKALRYSKSSDKGSFAFALFWLFAITLLVFLNWLSFFILLPILLYSLLGIESEFVSSPFAFFNTTFFVMVGVFTYLTVDPFVKVYYLLRCYYLDAVTTGADLRDQLALSKQGKQFLLLALLAISMTGFAPDTVAADTSRIDQSIEEVSMDKKYLWRYPPEMVRKEQGEPPAVIQSIQNWVQSINKSVAASIEDFTHWLRDFFKEKEDQKPDITRSVDTAGVLHGLVTTLLIILAIIFFALIVLIIVQAVRENKIVSNSHGLQQGERPDLNDEKTSAADLPTNRWLAYARELQAKGEWRLALRALFLAQIALLADQQLLSIARFKSNHDYELELQRRSHIHPEKLTAFQFGRTLFESRWYGHYIATAQDVEQLKQKVEQEVMV